MIHFNYILASFKENESKFSENESKPLNTKIHKIKINTTCITSVFLIRIIQHHIETLFPIFFTWLQWRKVLSLFYCRQEDDEAVDFTLEQTRVVNLSLWSISNPLPPDSSNQSSFDDFIGRYGLYLGENFETKNTKIRYTPVTPASSLFDSTVCV